MTNNNTFKQELVRLKSQASVDLHVSRGGLISPILLLRGKRVNINCTALGIYFSCFLLLKLDDDGFLGI